MSERGVFAVDRGIFTDPDFASEPFTEREAFMWLVSEAAWKPHAKRADGKVVQLQRGQLCHSVRFMGEAWQWSKSRVDRFLDRLETRDMIKRDRGTRTPVLTLCKYEAFQRVSLPGRDNIGTTPGTTAGQERDKLEDRENKELSSSLRSEAIAAAPKAKQAKVPAGCRIPDDFDPSADIAVELGMTPERARLQAAQFLDHWRSVSGSKGIKRDWVAAWRTWIRNDIDWNGAKSPSKARQGNERSYGRQQSPHDDLDAAFANIAARRDVREPSGSDRERPFAPPDSISTRELSLDRGEDGSFGHRGFRPELVVGRR